jgi:hypothetical protein
MWHGDCHDGEEPCCGPLGYFFTPLHNGPFRAKPSSLLRPHDYTQTHHIPLQSSGPMIGTTQRPLPAQHTALTSERLPCPLAGFEPAILAGKRPQIHFIDRAATEIGHPGYYTTLIQRSNHFFLRRSWRWYPLQIAWLWKWMCVVT